MGERRVRLQSIQYLRALAAMMVVFHHAANGRVWMLQPWPMTDAGAAGVSVFFVVSGLVIYAAARGESPREFARRRLIRVVPLYWCATTAYLALMLHRPQDYAQVALDYVRSLLFIPYHMPGHPEVIFALLVPGWSLNYEMFFYLLFFVGILLGRPTLFLIAAIGVLVVAGTLIVSDDALVRTYTNPRLLQFLAGVLIGAALSRRWLPPLVWLLPLATVAMLAAICLPTLLPWLYPVAAIALVLGAVAAEGRGPIPDVPLLTLLGDASYSIYLSHTFTLIGFELIFKRLPLAYGWGQFIAWLAGALILSALIGIWIHRHIEKPMLAFFGRVTRPSGAPAPRGA